MRVIAGSARGVRLAAPPGRAIRPTPDRAREALFNILGRRVEGARFLDLFAGTGANGIEALSRGASGAVFVDSASESLKYIRRNVEAARVRGAEYLKLVLPTQLPAIRGPFNVIFCDPPYAYEEYEALLRGIGESGVLAAEGMVVVEHGPQHGPPASTAELTRYDERRYGDTRFAFYRNAYEL